AYKKTEKSIVWYNKDIQIQNQIADVRYFSWAPDQSRLLVYANNKGYSFYDELGKSLKEFPYMIVANNFKKSIWNTNNEVYVFRNTKEKYYVDQVKVFEKINVYEDKIIDIDRKIKI